MVAPYAYGRGDADPQPVVLVGAPGMPADAPAVVLLPDGTQLVCVSKEGARAVRDVLNSLVLRQIAPV